MEEQNSLIQTLVNEVEQYGKTRMELIKLKAIDKVANAASIGISRLLLVVVIIFFVSSLNIGVALWLGNLLGADYYGFLLVALFYGIVGVILYFSHSSIKSRVNNSIIEKVFS